MSEQKHRYYIYALLHEGEIFYIGQTMQSPMGRLYSHMGEAAFRSRSGGYINKLQEYLLTLNEYPDILVLYEFEGYQWQANELERIYIASLTNYFNLKNTHHTKHPMNICQITKAMLDMFCASTEEEYWSIGCNRIVSLLEIPYQSFDGAIDIGHQDSKRKWNILKLKLDALSIQIGSALMPVLTSMTD